MALMSLVHCFHKYGFFMSIFCVLHLQRATGRELKFVILVMRHGDRTPAATYPTDPYKEDIWPQGFGQLTTIGMQQHFKLGQLLRERYKNFLSNEYHKKEIHILSTDGDQDIMSAQANLAGLFLPTEKQTWNKGINWRPVPVHTVPIEDEQLFFSPVPNCTHFDNLVKETMNLDKIKDKLKSKEKWMTELAGHTGYDVKTLWEFSNHKLWNVYDTLSIQKSHGFKLPEWASSEILDQLKEMMTDRLSVLYGTYNRKAKSRMQGGVLLKDILEKITKATQSAPEAKMIMYSAYSVTIVALQIALNVFKRILPSYAACYFFELYQESKGDYTIEMHYRDSYEKDQPTPVILPGCTAACPLQTFEKLVSPIIPNSLKEECNK